MTATINLTKGYTAIVDDCDADLAELKWSVFFGESKNQYSPYAVRTDSAYTTRLHRVIMARMLGRPLKSSEKVDHWNGDGLLNTRENLRLANSHQNGCNREVSKNSPAGLKGVYRNPMSKTTPWKTSINVDGKTRYLGTFTTPIEAHRTYCIAALKHYGEWANFGSTSPFLGWTLKEIERGYKQLELPLFQEAA